MQPRISLITLGVADVGRARAFYEALGWTGQSPDGEVVFFQVGGLVVALWGRDLLAEDSVADDTGAAWGGITLAHNVRAAADVDAVLAEATAAGGTVRRPGAPTPWGGYSGVFAAPDGHVWEVAHNPAWPIDDHGNVTLRLG
ncbi:MAG: VOC family protein [Acidimicrobiales bacterium]|nr:VOC family protein [Acidimicrobiales bacterium]